MIAMSEMTKLEVEQSEPKRELEPSWVWTRSKAYKEA